MKKVFSYNADINKTAYLNWRTNEHEPIHNMNVLAQGYMLGATVMIDDCLENNIVDCRADAMIFPILFSFNQAIELYLKSLYWSINILLGYKSGYKENHDIRGIWLTVKQKVFEFGFNVEGASEEGFTNMTKTLESYIYELTDKIKINNDVNTAFHNIDFSRYPLNNRKEKHFYVTEYDNVVVDLENFLSVVKEVYDTLDRLASFYYQLVVDSWQSE